MNIDINTKKKEISEIAKEHGLEMVVLFGSQATGRTHAKSDVDIGVISRNKFDIFGLTTDFYKFLKRDDVEVVDLSRASPTLMRAIVIDGKLLYERKRADFLNWKFYAIKTWMDTDWLRRLAKKNIIEWAHQIA